MTGRQKGCLLLLKAMLSEGESSHLIFYILLRRLKGGGTREGQGEGRHCFTTSSLAFYGWSQVNSVRMRLFFDSDAGTSAAVLRETFSPQNSLVCWMRPFSVDNDV